MAVSNDFSCAVTAVLLARVRRQGGEEAVGRLLALAGSPRDVGYLEDLGNWISYDETVALWEAGASVTGDDGFARAVGADFVGQLAGSSNSNVLRALGSPENLLRNVGRAGHRFSTAADLSIVHATAGSAEVRATAAAGFDRHRLHCEWTAGMLTQSTALFGLPPADVRESRCQARGADACVYHVSWSVDAPEELDPAERARSLQDQLDAMSRRLQDVFDTAADLIASEDLDGTLARITDRAALQVRAPRYLLAVRARPGSPGHTHQKGFEAHEAHEVARRVLARDERVTPENWLVAEVASARHHYGALVAVQKPGADFFPHERQLLEVYARYAATALDTATAIADARARQREAQRRYDETQALIALARKLAHADTSDQVAQRVAEAVPGVIDCDRVSVYLWSEERERLEGRASAEAHGAPASAPTPAVGDIPRLRQWLDHPSPEPVFLDLPTSPVRAALEGVGAVAAVAVPIATPDRFLGCFVASVRTGPERLAPDPELAERLSGVAAHAIAALQNGRLVDHITHQATHDQLTGAANRAGFHDELVAATNEPGAAGAATALFYLDLDGFKAINDEHGHEVGDRVLQHVVERLRDAVDDADTVARLGGDEFVVIARDLRSTADVEAVAARLDRAFGEPVAAEGHRLAVRASVGRAVWPADATEPEALLRHADAEMYRHKHARR